MPRQPPPLFSIVSNPPAFAGVNEILDPPIMAKLAINGFEAADRGITPDFAVFASVTLLNDQGLICDRVLGGTMTVTGQGPISPPESLGRFGVTTIYFSWRDLYIASPGTYHLRVRLYAGHPGDPLAARRLDLYVDTKDVVVTVE